MARGICADPVNEAERRRKISDAQKGEKHHLYGRHHSEETRRKISDARKGEKNHMYGKHRSEETRRKISDAHKGEKHHLYGKHHSEETRRKMSDAKKGENGPNWKGGISFEPYCPKFNREFKERVRAFFGRVCVECGTPENGKKLHVHHVNFNKMSCCDNAPPLFVALCASCHSKTNNNREYWEQHFTTIINEKHGGKCYTVVA